MNDNTKLTILLTIMVLCAALILAILQFGGGVLNLEYEMNDPAKEQLREDDEDIFGYGVLRVPA